jgi:hypothetical protein
MPTTQPSLVTINPTDLISTGPGKLNSNFSALNQNASELIAGKVQIATSGDVATGTDDLLSITPLKLEYKLINTNNVWPKTNATYDLGSSSLRYNKTYLNDCIDFNGQTLTVDGGGTLLVNGSPISFGTVTGFVSLTGDETVQGIKTFLNEIRSETGLTLSAANAFLTFDELGTGDSGITFKEAGATIGSILFDQTSQAVKARINDTFNYSWQFASEVIFGEGVKTAPDFVSGVANNGISASKIKRFKYNVNDSMTTVSGANVAVDWSGVAPFTVYVDEGESGQTIVAQNQTDIYLPPLTRDGGATNSGGVEYTIVNMSNNQNVEIFGDTSLSETIAGSASLSNSTRFSTITLRGIYKREFGTGAKEGFWVIVSKEGTWV